MTLEQVFEFVQQGGAYCAPLLLLGLVWLAHDRDRVIKDNARKDEALKELAERVITISTELKTFLFTERKS